MIISKLNCSIGILIHNEAQNIGKLLDALLRQTLEKVAISEIIVISSASNDGSDDIVEKHSLANKNVRLIREAERKGKSAAINTFLKEAKENIVLISSGDIIPEKDTIEKMIEPFTDNRIGMTGSHPIPVNKPDSFTGFWVNLQWNLHHRIALQSPKLGEMVAFRKVLDRIPADSPVDEASIEAIITKMGLQLKYIPEAVVYNKGPESIAEFIKQRRRIAAGHIWLKRQNSYLVSTNKPFLLLKALGSEIRQNPFRIHYILFICLLEIWSRFLGWFDLIILKRNPYKWEIIDSTKKLAQEDN